MSYDKKQSSGYSGLFGYKKKKPGSAKSDKQSEPDDTNRFRWAAEFMAGPGGYLEKAEVVSGWFEKMDDAREDALENAQREVDEYPFSRRSILKLILEDDNGKITVLTNAKDNIPIR